MPKLSKQWSLPLMRKTFIEAPDERVLDDRAEVSSAYAEDFH